jgi:hypothetical protein
VPVPDDVRPAPGTDGHLTIWQPSRDRLWEFYRFGGVAGGWRAVWGGVIERVSRSPGYYTERSAPGARHTWGATATSLPVVAGTMLISELRAGEVPHALAMAIPYPRRGIWSWPAQRSDGRGDGRQLPEGAHLRLDPAYDVDAAGLDPVTEAIARAAQRYGMILRDGTHTGIALYGEDPHETAQREGANPYPTIFGGQYPNDLLGEFPWDRLQVLRMHRCTDVRRPCPQR